MKHLNDGGGGMAKVEGSEKQRGAGMENWRLRGKTVEEGRRRLREIVVEERRREAMSLGGFGAGGVGSKEEGGNIGFCI